MNSGQKRLYLILGVLVFIISSLFFAITNHIAGDVEAAKLEKINRTVSTKPALQTPQAESTSTTTGASESNLKPPVKSLTAETEKSLYIEITDGCSEHFGGECLRVRSGPGTEFPAIAKLRNGIVLKVADTISNASGTWHKIIFDEWLRYPERLGGDWYVSGDFVRTFTDVGIELLSSSTPSTSKKIIVERDKQMLYAYDGDELFMTATTSTGLDLSPTPRGIFTIFKKTPTRYMQGPLPYLPNSDYYDLPGVPWNLYFTEAGAVVHGAYWHNSFGTQYSHGCVNLDPTVAEKLYHWVDVGATIVVRD